MAPMVYFAPWRAESAGSSVHPTHRGPHPPGSSAHQAPSSTHLHRTAPSYIPMAGNGISISEALQSDLPVMVALRCAATEEDIIFRFLFDHRRSVAVQMETESLMASLGKRFTNPTNRCHIHKAVDNDSGELVAWALVSWGDGQWQPVPPRDDNTSPPPTFPVYYQHEVRRNWIKLTAGQPHVILGALYVRPDRQRQGIGQQLVEYLYTKYDLNNELVIVQTRAMSEGFYAKLGWTTVDSTDIDLSLWAGEGRGYGWHKSPQMMRYPKTSEHKPS